jgi:Cu+-exporting ATPase
LPLRQRLVVSALLSVPVIAMAMIPALQFTYWQWLSLTLAAPVVVWGALAVPPGGLDQPQARRRDDGHAGERSGTLAAFLWSLYALFFGHGRDARHDAPLRVDAIAMTGWRRYIYLEAAAGVTTFILLGRWLEHRSKRQAGAALKSLMELGAKHVTVLRDGRE